ncbi:MAG: ABC transporter substrate-binding protein [Oscillibacter sp.]|nr:ABC transporter substrate-binding protein [Oscillibacter sp.]
MKKVLALILALSMALSLAACGGDSGSGSSTGGDSQTSGDSGSSTGGDSQTSGDSGSSGDKVVKIGVFEPATGDSGAGGKQEMLGMQYANKVTPTVEIGGETYTVELVYADNGSSSDKAPTAAAELVGKGVSLVLGSYGSGVSMAGGPVFDEAGLCAIGVTCTNPNVTAGNDYYFRICFLDNFQAQVLVNFAQDKFSAQKAYLLGELGNEYDQGLITFFEQTFPGTVTKASFPANTSDFTTYLNQAVAEGADVIFCPVSIAYATQIIKQAASMNLDIPLLGSDTLDNNTVLEAAKDSNVQLYVSTFYQEGGSPEFDDGIKAWLAEDSTAMTNNGGNDTIAAVTAMGYDAYYTALEVLKAAGSLDLAAIKATLPGVTYTGVSGAIGFDSTGDAVRDTAYIKTSDNATGTWALETVQTAS